jgi:hypothetical protein
VSTWPNDLGEGYQLYTGTYGGLDDRVKRRKRKQPLGFAPQQPKKTPAKRTRKK